MSGLAGALNISDTERAFINTVGQQVVFDAVNQLLAEYNEEVNSQTAVFVERQTEKFKMRYLLPGGGKLQQLGEQAPAGAMKRYGKFDVGFPLRGWGAQFSGARVPMAYMSIAELDAHLDTIMIQDLNTLRWRILLSIFEDTNLTFTDPIHGSITVTRLANTDGTLFPPVLGSETEADDDHYAETAYNVAAIADANNPVDTTVQEIAEHFGGVGSSGKNFVYFHGADQTAYLAAITGYVPVSDFAVLEGDDQDRFRASIPNVPGRVHGRLSGAFLSEWDGWIPDTYCICILLGVPAPLLMRVDPADTGLVSGLHLVTTNDQYPFISAHYENRFGFGCGNRLSAAVLEISGGGATYTPPTAYTE